MCVYHWGSMGVFGAHVCTTWQLDVSMRFLPLTLLLSKLLQMLAMQVAFLHLSLKWEFNGSQ